LQPKVKDGRVVFKIQARLYFKDELVYERTDAPAFAVGQDQAEALARRPFVYEDRFPVAPGDYRLEVSAVNNASGRNYDAARQVSASELGRGLYASDLLIAGRSQPDPRDRPFRFGGTRFEPLAGGLTQSSQPLAVLFQVKGAGATPRSLAAEYVIGSVSGKFRKTFEGEVDLTRPDEAGFVWAARTLNLDELPPGAYMLALRLRNPQTGEVIGRSARFQVAGQERERPIVVARPLAAGTQAAAAMHYERALCWLAQQRPEEALREAEASWRLSQTSAARQLLDRLNARAHGVARN
jgi:hypothetical protein